MPKEAWTTVINQEDLVNTNPHNIELFNASLGVKDYKYTFYASEKDARVSIEGVEIKIPAGYQITVCDITPPIITDEFIPGGITQAGIEITNIEVTELNKENFK